MLYEHTLCKVCMCVCVQHINVCRCLAHVYSEESQSRTSDAIFCCSHRTRSSPFLLGCLGSKTLRSTSFCSSKVGLQVCCYVQLLSYVLEILTQVLMIYFKKIFIIIFKYTVADFRHTRRRCQISLLMAVSQHMVARI